MEMNGRNQKYSTLQPGLLIVRQFHVFPEHVMKTR